MMLKECLVLVISVHIFLNVSVVKASDDDDDLMDFDFDSVVNKPSNDSAATPKFDSAFDDFLDIIAVEPPGQGSHIAQKETRVKGKLVRAWKNPSMQRKFAEVLPILKVMTSEQKIALAALVSAQVGSKQGRELNLDQVKVMFGDRKELILPLVLDIANLVRMAAESNEAAPQPPPRAGNTLAVRDQYESLPSAEFLRAEPEAQPSVPNSAIHDDRLNIDLDEDKPKIRDARSFNNNQQRAFLVTRSAPFYDHLFKKMGPNQRPPMASQKAPALQRRVDSVNAPGAAPSNLPLNQKPFVVPTTPPPTTTTPKIAIVRGNDSLNEIEELALNGLNGTLMDDPERDNNGTTTTDDSADDDDEALPTAEKLIGGRYRKRPPSRYSNRLPGSTYSAASLCEKFTGSVCLRVEDYPMEQIMGSIRRHKYAMGALLAEYRDKSDDVEHIDYSGDFNSAYHRRREDETGQPSPGAMCPSLIRYARPQKARSASGEWKFIVNTGQHTQTLRLEKCSKPQESCTYLTDNFRSRCIQVYNYHRLLSWDKTRGLHVDIFKVPTCCSCRIDGYKEVFPPLTHFGSSNSFGSSNTFAPSNNFAGSNAYHDFHPSATSNIRSPYGNVRGDIDDEDEDNEDEEEEDDDEDLVGYQYSNGFKRKKATKSSSIDSYLAPPGKYESIPFKRGPSTSSVPSSTHALKKRPNRNNNRDLSVAGSRSDTVISPKLSLTTEPVRRTTTSNLNIEAKSSPRHKLDKDAVVDQDHGASRINYNYHPIIDFFEESEETEQPPVKEARTAPQGEDWRPMVNGLKSL